MSYTFDTQKCQLGMASRRLDAIVGIYVYQHALIHDLGYDAMLLQRQVGGSYNCNSKSEEGEGGGVGFGSQCSSATL